MGRRRRFFCPSAQHPHMNTTVETPATEAPPKSRWKLWIVGFLLLGAGGYAVYRFGTGAPAESSQQQGRGGGPGFGGPGGRGFGGGGFGRGQVVPVRVVPATKQNLDVYLRALGTVTPINTVTVRTRLDGELVKVNFTEGQRVAKGQVLAEIDTRPYQVQLAQAQGALEENQARLRNARDRPRALPEAAAGAADHRAAGGRPGSAGPAVERRHPVQRGAGRERAPQPELRTHRGADRRPARPAPGRRRQHRARAATQNGIVVITQMRPISVMFTVPETELPPVLEAHARRPPPVGRGVGSRRRRQARDRHAADRRQPDRHGDRHHQAARDLRERRRVAVPEPVRQHPPAGAHARERDGHPGGGDPARGRSATFVYVVKPGQAGDGRDPARHARPDRGRARRRDERPGAGRRSCSKASTS